MAGSVRAENLRRLSFGVVAVLALAASAASAHNFDAIPRPDPDLASGVEKNAVFAFCPQMVRDGRHSSYLGRYGLRENEDSASDWSYTSELFLGSQIDVLPDSDEGTCTVAISQSAIPFNPTSTRRVLEGGMRSRGYRLVDDADGIRVFLKTDSASGDVYAYSLSETADSVTVTFLIQAG